MDDGNGTVTDRRTCLTWEKKTGTVGDVVACQGETDCPDPHHVNNVFSWGDGMPGHYNGTAVTQYLARLNGSAFAGHTDRRLPTSAGRPDCGSPTGADPELESIMEGVSPNTPSSCNSNNLPPCTTPGCIDQTLFGPVREAAYWTMSSPNRPFAWGILFSNGWVGADDSRHAFAVRAVRGGPGAP